MEQIRATLKYLLKAYFGGCFGCLGALSAMVVSAVTTFKLGETGGAYIWVKGPKGASVSFELWQTAPDGKRERFGPTFRTDSESKPISAGMMLSTPPMKGNYKVEAVIGTTTVGSTTFEVQ